jgi:hypothetical protein
MSVLLTAFVAVAAIMVGGVGAGSGSHSATARLWLVDTDPTTVRAAGFKAHEHARLSVIDDKQVVRRAVTAGSGGGFTMRLPGVDANACAGFSITAIGDHGSRATFKRLPGVCPNQ